MFGSFGELTRHKLAAERSHIAEMLNMLIDPVVAIILDYVTIDPVIVDALSIKENSVFVHEITPDSKIYYDYSHARRKGPCLVVVTVGHDNMIRGARDYKRANALSEVMRLLTSNECTQIYYALIDGYRSILRSPPDAEYDQEPANGLFSEHEAGPS